ncbi:restriction endonuclease [Paenibacillus luteus]|uniref:nSTAND3 domain-containing NTPase n=1 Tax=Paenibacillus luteus TaxID=2545753 RepID=UPI0011413143|nr:restriction endonuclease [Paenibacillus luteus]
MSNYDFHSLLEPLEFEKLVCDIIQKRDCIVLKMYKEGRDMGIDGLYIDGNFKTIVQAKRYQPDFKKLYRDLEHFELPKVRKLKPNRYILGISMELSPNEENNIIQLFEGFILNNHDILHSKDMNSFLEDPLYKQILLRYPKLWLPNTNVMEKILVESVYRAAYRESAEELKEAIRVAKTFVPTQIYHEALRKCSHNHVIVLSGEPGVGKTTMAYILALAYLQPNNLDGFIWANSINDVYAMLEDEKQQVIILDDFWGSIFLGEHTRRNDENRLDKLIKRIVEFHGKKRLILTTREYILQQGLQKHPLLRNTLDQYALICTLEEYGDDEKASILYSHLYVSNLEYEYVNYLFMKTDRIIHHQNYNPRVLALFLNNKYNQDCSPEEYYELLCNYFDNPEEFWESIFMDLSTESQIVSLLLLISSTPMHFESIKRCYEQYIVISSTYMNVKNIDECIAELEKTMIKTFYSEEYEAVLLKFNMPAIQDFLYGYLQKHCESLVPKILECCVYYNQLLFLLEHLSDSCSDRIMELIVQHCIAHYDEYSDSILEYDGSWNWEIDLFEETNGQLDRFFNLLRCCQQKEHLSLYRFLETEINDYCLTMGNGDLEAQYKDMHNLPDIIASCIKLGMNFEGKTIISNYYKNAFSIYHYKAMRDFQDVFPEEYSLFYESHFKMIQSNLRNTILLEIDFLEEFGMFFELDVLVDSIPSLMKQFGLRYTKEFGEQIYDLCGRKPILIPNKKVKTNNPSESDIDLKHHTLKNVKEDAKNWLLGPSETYLDDDQIDEFITNSDLNSAIKAELKTILETSTPWYIYDLLQTKEAIDLLIAVLCVPNPHIPEGEVNLLSSIVLHFSQGDQILLYKLISFCAECLSLFICRDEPILRANQFFTSDVYATYLEHNTQLRNVVFEYLIIKDEQWIRFLHIPLFILCNACIICFGSDDEELETYYSDIFGDNLIKLKQVIPYGSNKQINILYADYFQYHFKNYEWEGYMYRMFEKLKPYHFNQTLVAPMIKNYLDRLGNGDESSKVLNIVSFSKLQFEYNTSATRLYFCSELNDELCMIEHLGISDLWDSDFPPQITKKLLKKLQKNELAHQSGDRWSVLVYKIKDVELLKEFGVYDAALKILQEIENKYSSFQTVNTQHSNPNN